MNRTQISLESAQYDWLVAEARRRRISLSGLIRKMVSEHSAKGGRKRDPLAAVAGIAAGSGDPIGREHNRFLYGKPGK